MQSEALLQVYIVDPMVALSRVNFASDFRVRQSARTEDSTLELDVHLSGDTVWLTQQQMAMLFQVKENNITYHIQGIYKTAELEPEATTQKIRVVRKEGERMVARTIDYYNLDMIISVGYRVNSEKAN